MLAGAPDVPVNSGHAVRAYPDEVESPPGRRSTSCTRTTIASVTGHANRTVPPYLANRTSHCNGRRIDCRSILGANGNRIATTRHPHCSGFRTAPLRQPRAYGAIGIAHGAASALENLAGDLSAQGGFVLRAWLRRNGAMRTLIAPTDLSSWAVGKRAHYPSWSARAGSPSAKR